MIKPVNTHRLKKSVDRDTLMERWPDSKQLFSDPAELDVSDLPADSFIQDDGQVQDDKDGYSDSTDIEYDSDIEGQEAAMDVVLGPCKPAASKEWVNGKPGPQFYIKEVERQDKVDGEILALVNVMDGENKCIPMEILSESAQDLYLTGDSLAEALLIKPIIYQHDTGAGWSLN